MKKLVSRREKARKCKENGVVELPVRLTEFTGEAVKVQRQSNMISPRC